MTSMALPGSRPKRSVSEVYDAAALRARLAGRWAILFSHPDDFAQEQLEMDRWIAVLSAAFDARGVAPVALARPGSDFGLGWLGRLAPLGGGSAVALTLDTPPGAFADFAASALRARIARGGPRLAVILDSSLRCRRTLSYRLPADLPSPLELIGWAAALRGRDSREGRPYEETCARDCDAPAVPETREQADRLAERLAGSAVNWADPAGLDRRHCPRA